MSVSGVRIRILGTVEIDGTTVGSQVGRTLLALLAVAPGRATSTSALIDGLWGETLPQHPSTALQVQVTRLRKRFAGPTTPLVSTPGGYVLHVDPGDVDLTRFHEAVDRAVAATDPAVAAGHARAALALWGEPFTGCLPGTRLDAERLRAEERMLRAVEILTAGELALDAPARAVDVVVPHLAEHRGRESLVVLAMTALHRSGRTVEALAVLAETRRYLRREYGVDPGAELRALEYELLSARVAGPVRGRPVVGREPLLAVIRARLDGANAGAIVLVRGEAGIGKTSLLRAAREEAAQRGARTGGGVWDADGEPLAAWGEALRELGVAHPTLDDPQPVRTLRRRLAERAAEEPVLLTLDDAHRADSVSRGTLRALARLGLPPGVVIVVAVRDPDVVAHPGWDDTRADLLRHPAVAELRITGLDRAAVDAVISFRLSGLQAHAHARDRLGDLLWRRCAGHPLHLDALLDAVVAAPDEAGAVAATGEVPGRLRALLAHQLERLPAPCREVVEALAVLAPVTLVDLADVLDREPRQVAADLRPAADLALIDPTEHGYAFRHELTALAARERVPVPEAAALHRARFVRLAASADPFERLRHAAGAGELFTPEVLADARLAAAAVARPCGALEEALELVEATDGVADPTVAAVARGLVLEALGRAAESDDVLDAVVADPGAAVEHAVDAAVGADAMGISVSGRPRRLARLAQVRERALDPHQRVRVLRALVVEQDQLQGGVGGAEMDDEALPELLALVADGRVDDDRSRAQVGLLRANRMADEPVAAAERVLHGERVHGLAVRTGDPALRLEAEELLVASLIAASRVDDAEALLERVAAESERRRHARSIWAVGMVRASLMLARGDADAATKAAEATMHRSTELGIPDAGGAFGVHLTVAHLLAGTLPSLGGVPAMAAQVYPHVAAWPAWAAVDAVHARDREAVAAHLAEYHRRRDGRPHRMFDRPGACAAALAAFVLGERPTARQALADLPEDPDAVVVVGIGAGILGPVSLYRGLALLALDEVAAARAAFVSAGRVADGLGWEPWVDAASALHRFAGAGDDLPLPLGLTPPRHGSP